ncbi:MAG: fatty acid desaturase family protein [Gammaproteobacteria bacterium]
MQSSAFQQRVQEEVSRYFNESQRSQRDAFAYYMKVILILTWAIGSYYFLIFTHFSYPYKIGFAISLSFAISGIGMNIAHDANHSACSRWRWVNQVLSFTFEIIGVSSFVWRIKHNKLHHYYTNVTNIDPDLDHSKLIRSVPEMKLQPFHQYQAYYIWLLYLFFTFRWHLTSDYLYFIKSFKKYMTRLPMLTKIKIISRFILGKLLSYSLYFVIPLFYYPWWLVLSFYFCIVALVGLILAPIFDVAHINDEVLFLPANEDMTVFNHDHAILQVSTTANFGAKNRFFSWYIGGLNYQIEHHLFPSTCHVHYPAISKIVRQVCQEFNIPYVKFDSFFAALRSHHKLLKKMGRQSVRV